MAFIIILIAVGLVLILAEILLIPGIGVAGILGLVSMGGSCFYAFHEYGSSTGTVVVVVNVVLLLWLTIYVLRAKTWKKLALNTNIDSKIQFFDEERIAVGDTGRTITRLAPMGMARIGEESCEVKSLEGIIDPGTEIEVVMIEDNRIYVKPVENDY